MAGNAGKYLSDLPLMLHFGNENRAGLQINTGLMSDLLRGKGCSRGNIFFKPGPGGFPGQQVVLL